MITVPANFFLRIRKKMPTYTKLPIGCNRATSHFLSTCYLFVITLIDTNFVSHFI